MKFGACASWTDAVALKAAGFEFIELNVQTHLKPLDDEAAFAPTLDAIRGSPLPALAANSFIPGAFKITGPDVNPARLTAYAETACHRASLAGLHTIVFGSGGARQIPDGFDRASAWRQLLDFGRAVAPLAEAHGITIVTEPLNHRECNVLTTVGECAEFVREINHPNCRLLVDAYHWLSDGDSIDDLVAAGPLLAHAHIATALSRKAPGLEPCDFASFFRALQLGGYNGPLSVEGRWDDIAADAPGVLEELRRWSAGR